MAVRDLEPEKILQQLTGLYQKDPERFERLSRELIRQAIESLPADRRQRAWGLQFRLDATLRHFKDPVARMNKMVEIFWEQFRHFQEVISDPVRALEEKEGKKAQGKVLPFRSRKIH